MADQIGSPGAFFADVDREGVALQRFFSLVNAIDAGIFQCDADLALVAVNDALLDLVGHERADLLDRHASAIIDDAGIDRLEAAVRTLREDDAEEHSLVVPIRTETGDAITCEVRASPLREEGRFRGVAGIVREIPDGDGRDREEQAADLKRRRDALESEIEDIFERVDDAFYALDEEFRFTYVNERAEELLEADRTELLGERVWEQYPEARETPAWDAFHEAMETQEPTSYEVYFDPLEFWVEANVYPSETGLSVYFQDVTDRKEHERELEQYRALTQSVSDVIVVIDEESTIRSVSPAVADVFGYDPEGLEGEHLMTLMASEVTDPHRGELEEYLEDGVRSADWEYVELTARDADGDTIPVAVSFSESEYEGERYFAGVLRDITERKERERELERQQMRLATLAHLNDVVHDITNAVVERSTREEIERAACERLVQSESYAFAWIAEIDPGSEEIIPRTEVGVDGYLEEIPTSVDPDESVGRGPAGRAVRTKEMQVTTDVFDDPDFEPWREYAEEYGFRSFAAIPVLHEGTLYGVMGVYSRRHGAFTDEERDVLGQLGEIVGHAIASVERKQALMGDEVTELDFHVVDLFSELDVGETADDRIWFDRIVPIGEDHHLVYGTAAEGDLHVLESLLEVLPYWDEVRIVSEDVDSVTFELTVTESRILASVASRGGDVREAYIEDGDYRLTVQVPPSVEVRSIADVVTDVYSTAELRAQRQVTRERDGPTRVAAAFQDELTDRQRHVVKSAYFAGYFEWPRESSGEDLAESLDIAPATFSQHLRTAQNQIFGALFEDRARSSTDSGS